MEGTCFLHACLAQRLPTWRGLVWVNGKLRGRVRFFSIQQVIVVVVVVVVLGYSPLFVRRFRHCRLCPSSLGTSLSSFYVIIFLSHRPVRSHAVRAGRVCLSPPPPGGQPSVKAPGNVIAGLAFPTLLSRPSLGSLGPLDLHCAATPATPALPTPRRNKGEKKGRYDADWLPDVQIAPALSLRCRSPRFLSHLVGFPSSYTRRYHA